MSHLTPLCSVECRYVEFHYCNTECHYAECHISECCGTIIVFTLPLLQPLVSSFHHVQKDKKFKLNKEKSMAGGDLTQAQIY